ncbi:6375_t:CDS:2 [Gigaspora rosea]|nr:6375_t:CDS:2 [Gigaspora rosea]
MVLYRCINHVPPVQGYYQGGSKNCCGTLEDRRSKMYLKMLSFFRSTIITGQDTGSQLRLGIDTHDSLPIQIGWNLSVKKIDSFFESQDTRGYKFEIDPKGNVFIVEMEGTVHCSVVKRLTKYFDVPNGAEADDPPIDVMGAASKKNSFGSLSLVISFIIFSCPIIEHYQPNGAGTPSAPDIAIYPGLTVVPIPPIPAPPPPRRFRSPRPSRHLEIPPVDLSGRTHARIMCEIAVLQSYSDWDAKCRRWMLQQYVRCVFGVKIYRPRPTRNANGQFDRCMIARLWTRQTAPVPERYTAVAGQVGVYYEEWNFGTVDYYLGVPTACTRPGLANYRVSIPTENVFWNPPVVGGVPATVGYTITVPRAVTAPNFIIDLFQIQHQILVNQINQ